MIRLIQVSLLLVILLYSCEADKINDGDPLIEIVINESAINIKSYTPKVAQKDRLFYLNDTLYTGVISQFENGKYFGEIHLKDGLFHGEFKEWFPDESLKTLKVYEHGYENGQQKGWHQNQNTSYTYDVINGLKEGVYKEFYPNGALQIERRYSKGEELHNKILNIDGGVIANYVKKDGRYYGLLGSSNCVSVFNQDLPKAKVEK